MKRSTALVLQIIVVLVGIGSLALMLWEPHLEGRNAQATVFEIYFNDPFLAYAYVGSTPFFVALIHAFKVLGLAGQNKVFSPAVLKALRTIKYCGVALIGVVAGAEIFIMLGDSDDRAGVVLMGLLATLGAIAMAAAAAIFERNLKNAAGMPQP